MTSNPRETRAHVLVSRAVLVQTAALRNDLLILYSYLLHDSYLAKGILLTVMTLWHIRTKIRHQVQFIQARPRHNTQQPQVIIIGIILMLRIVIMTVDFCFMFCVKRFS